MVVVVVDVDVEVAMDPGFMLEGPPETARAFPTSPSTHASLDVPGNVPNADDARLLDFGPAAPRGVYLVLVVVGDATTVVVVTPELLMVEERLAETSPPWPGYPGGPNGETPESGSMAVVVTAPVESEMVAMVGDIVVNVTGIAGTGGVVKILCLFWPLSP